MFSKCKAAVALAALGAGQLAQAIFLFRGVDRESPSSIDPIYSF